MEYFLLEEGLHLSNLHGLERELTPETLYYEVIALTEWAH